jgi:hypothetical protein
VDQLVDQIAAAGPTLQSARWRRFAQVWVLCSVFTACFGTIPLGVWVYNQDSVPVDAHWNAAQDAVFWTAAGLMVLGVGGTAYVARLLWKRPLLRTSTFGVTVYNWRSSIDVPWAEFDRVVLVGAQRMRRAGWVLALARSGGAPVPMRFGPFLPAAAGRSTAVAPPVPAEGGWAVIVGVIEKARPGHVAAAPVPPGTLEAALADGHETPGAAHVAGNGAASVAAPGAAKGGAAWRDPLALPADSEVGWGNGRVVVAKDWVAYKESKGKVPWNLLAYGELAEAHRDPRGAIAVARADGTGLVIDKAVRQSLEGLEMLCPGLDGVATADLKAELEADLTKARGAREAQMARWHKVDPTGTVHTYTFRGPVIPWFGWILVLGGICALGGAVAFPIYGQPFDLVVELILVGFGVFGLWGGFCMTRLGVTIGPDRMLLRNEFSFRRVDPRQVRALTLLLRNKGEAGVMWEARVDLESGKRVRITSMSYGKGGAPPRPERLQILNQMREVLGVAGRQEGY